MKKINTENEFILSVVIFNELCNWYIANGAFLKSIDLDGNDNDIYLINARSLTDIYIKKFFIVPIKDNSIDIIDIDKLKSIDTALIINIGMRYQEVNGESSFAKSTNKYLSIISGLNNLISSNGISWNKTKDKNLISDIAMVVLKD